jgi:hypothetical protein
MYTGTIQSYAFQYCTWTETRRCHIHLSQDNGFTRLLLLRLSRECLNGDGDAADTNAVLYSHTPISTRMASTKGQTYNDTVRARHSRATALRPRPNPDNTDRAAVQAKQHVHVLQSDAQQTEQLRARRGVGL